MEKGVVLGADYPKLASKAHSSQGCASSSQATQEASSSIDITT